jgi:hypothetical protein
MDEKNTAYEAPVLVKVGNAEDAIRGVAFRGYDADLMFTPNSDEFQSELGVND